MNILLTGGTGYIGSHTAVALAAKGHKIVLYDNLCNSQQDVVDWVEEITGQKIDFIENDVRNTSYLANLFKEQDIDAVVHFAGFKAVGESVEKPIDYYANNVQGSISLFQAMQSCRGQGHRI